MDKMATEALRRGWAIGPGTRVAGERDDLSRLLAAKVAGKSGAGIFSKVLSWLPIPPSIR